MTRTQWEIIVGGIAVVIFYYFYKQAKSGSATSQSPFFNPQGSQLSVLNAGNYGNPSAANFNPGVVQGAGYEDGEDF